MSEEAKQQVGSIWSYFVKNEHKKMLTGEFTAFKELMEETGLGAEELAKQVGGVDKSVLDYAKSNDIAKLSVDGFKKSIGNLSLGAKAASVAMKGLAMAGNMLLILAVTEVINLAVKAISNYVHRLDNAKDALESTNSEIESIQQQVEEITSKINELRDKDNLSITDKEDLEQLKLQNKELKIRQDYLNEQKKDEAEKVATYTKQKYKQNYGKTVTRDDINKYKNSYDNPVTNSVSSYLTGGSTTTSSSYGAGAQARENTEVNELAKLIAEYEHYNELKKQAVQDNDSKFIDKYNKKLKSLKKQLSDNRTELQGYSDDLAATGDNSPELDEIRNKLQLIDDTLLSPGQNLVNFINSKELDDDREKLVSLANSGELTQGVLEKNFKNVSKYLKDNGLTLEDSLPFFIPIHAPP